jgi:hypothetical protein
LTQALSLSVNVNPLRSWINFPWLNKPAANLKSVSATDTNHFVRPTWFSAASPNLLVNGDVPFTSDLAIIEPVALKFFWQWLIELAFLTPTLSRSARFCRPPWHQLPHEVEVAFLIGSRERIHQPAAFRSNLASALSQAGTLNRTARPILRIGRIFRATQF